MLTADQRRLADVWYRHLREWREVQAPRPPRLKTGGGHVRVIAGQYGPPSYVLLPVGWVSAEVLHGVVMGQDWPVRELIQIVRQAPKRRVTGETLPSRLLRRDGRWTGPESRMAGLAVACLKLAEAFERRW